MTEGATTAIKFGVCLLITAFCIAMTLQLSDKGVDTANEAISMMKDAAGSVDDSELFSYNNRKISGSAAANLLGIYGLRYPVVIATSMVPSGFYRIDRLLVESSDQYLPADYQFIVQVVQDANSEVEIIRVTQDGVDPPNYDLIRAREELAAAVTTKYEVAVKQYNLYRKQNELDKSIQSWSKEGMNHLQNTGHDASSVDYWNTQYSGCASIADEYAAKVNNKITALLY